MTRILFVCTANRCRSPFAAALTEKLAGQRGIDVQVESSGLLREGESVPRDGVIMGRKYGIELSGHLSRRLSVEAVENADIVLAMARGHAREAVALVPERRGRIFTLPQFTRWCADVRVPRHAQIGPWLDLAADDRPPEDLLGSSSTDDIADPIGRPRREWSRMAERLDSETSALLDALES